MKKHMTPIELQEEGMRVLVRELGYVDAMRFMLQFRRGKGDYSKERHKLLKGVTIEDALRASERVIKDAKAAKTRRRRSA